MSSNNPISSQEVYKEYVNKKSPNSPILKNCFNAFWVGRPYLYYWTNNF